MEEDVLKEIIASHFQVPVIGINDIKNENAEETTLETEDQKQDLNDHPDDVIEDILEELSDACDSIVAENPEAGEYAIAMIYSFIDGILSYSGDSYSTYEDLYAERSSESAYSDIDDIVDEYAQRASEENRLWDEATKGYIRHLSDELEKLPEQNNLTEWTARIKAHILGLNAAEDYEWKVINGPNNTVLFTDEEEIEDYSARKFEESLAKNDNGGGGLFSKLGKMIGFDLGEIGEALDQMIDEEEMQQILEEEFDKEKDRDENESEI